jgi:drug/metabolite transporter (DMT)-like permease
MLWSISSVVVKKISRTYDPIVITAMALWIATVLSIPCSFAEITSVKNYDIFTPQSIACIVYLGIIGTAVPNLLWNLSLSILTGSKRSMQTK